MANQRTGGGRSRPQTRFRDPEVAGLSNADRDSKAYDAGLHQVDERIGRRRYSEYLSRNQNRQMLGQAFATPAREAYYGTLYDSALQSGLGNAYETANVQNRKAMFNAADRGVLGGSSDIDKRAGVGRALDYASIGAQNQAYDFANQYRRNDEDKQVNLMRLIESGDPTSQAAFAQQLRGIGDQTQQGLIQNQLGQLRQQQSQAAQNANSQNLGSALSWAGTQFGIDQNARAYGGQGLGWMPQFGYTNNSGMGSE